MDEIFIDIGRLLARLNQLGSVGRDRNGRLSRLAATDEDRLGRDLLVSWFRGAGLEVLVDRVGNIFGMWSPTSVIEHEPILMGSHIDTVIDAGIYDGCYGVLAGLEVIERLKAEGMRPLRPIVVAAFTNEEGVRYAPDMMGSRVYAGQMSTDTALAAIGTDGSSLGAELRRIGYQGLQEPDFLKPAIYLELHIEQGPVLEQKGVDIGVVENLQGISWRKLTIEGEANHAGTTPMSMRKDAGHAAACIMTWLYNRAQVSTTGGVVTVGSVAFHPNAINVIPAWAEMTIDLRNPDAASLLAEEKALMTFLSEFEKQTGVRVSVEQLARSEPVTFGQTVVEAIEAAAISRGFSHHRMTSGAGHDAQMLASIVPTAMIFVPSIGGISHNPLEATAIADIEAGANVLLDVVFRFAKE